jgi:hypothetical protein
MNLSKAYIKGFQKAATLPRMLFIVYFANFFTALILALTFKGVIENAFGQSGILSSLLENFDYTTFSEVMYKNGDSIWAVIGGIKWLIIAYFLLSIFLTGGIINTLKVGKFTTSDFFGGAAYNFFRFLGLSLLMIFVQLIFLLAVYIPLGTVLKSVSENMTSEVSLYYIAIGGFVLHLLIFLLISMIGDYAKLYISLNDSFNVFKGFWNGVKYVFKNFSKTYFLYLFLLFLPGVVMYLYLFLERDIKMASGIGILIVFAMQQAFMLLRVFLRTWILSSEYLVYNDDFIKLNNRQDIAFSVVDTKTNTEKQIVDEPVIAIISEPVKEVGADPVMDIVKEPVNEVIIETKKETLIEPEKKSKDINSEYVIDFSKTFTTHDDETDSDEQIITEEEMLKKIREEESHFENNLVTASDETDDVENENETSEPDNIIAEDESGLDENKDKTNTKKSNKDIIEFE